MNIRTEIDIRNYIFKIYINGNIYKVFEGNYPKFLLTLDLLNGGYLIPVRGGTGG